ncbi:unnamed protein product, partial [Brassicogethes aeneus]
IVRLDSQDHESAGQDGVVEKKEKEGHQETVDTPLTSPSDDLPIQGSDASSVIFASTPASRKHEFPGALPPSLPNNGASSSPVPAPTPPNVPAPSPAPAQQPPHHHPPILAAATIPSAPATTTQTPSAATAAGPTAPGLLKPIPVSSPAPATPAISSGMHPPPQASVPTAAAALPPQPAAAAPASHHPPALDSSAMPGGHAMRTADSPAVATSANAAVAPSPAYHHPSYQPLYAPYASVHSTTTQYTSMGTSSSAAAAPLPPPPSIASMAAPPATAVSTAGGHRAAPPHEREPLHQLLPPPPKMVAALPRVPSPHASATSGGASREQRDRERERERDRDRERERESYSSSVTSLSRSSASTTTLSCPPPSSSSTTAVSSSLLTSGGGVGGPAPAPKPWPPPPTQQQPATSSGLPSAAPRLSPAPPPPRPTPPLHASFPAAPMFAAPMPPPVSAPSPLTTPPVAANPNPFSAESLFQNNQTDMLRRELDNRFLASQDRSLGVAPPPYLRTEMHQHQHHHTHVHQHTTSLLPPPAASSIFPSPLTMSPMERLARRSQSSFKDIPKIGSVESPFYRQNLGMPNYPGYSAPGLMHHGLTTGPTPFAPPNHLPPFQPKSTVPSDPTKPKIVKSGKWNAMHVRVAWEIYHHQQKSGEAKGQITPAKPSTELLRPPTHPYSTATHGAGARPPSHHDLSPFGHRPPGFDPQPHHPGSLFGPTAAHLGKSPFAAGASTISPFTRYGGGPLGAASGSPFSVSPFAAAARDGHLSLSAALHHADPWRSAAMQRFPPPPSSVSQLPPTLPGLPPPQPPAPWTVKPDPVLEQQRERESREREERERERLRREREERERREREEKQRRLEQQQQQERERERREKERRELERREMERERERLLHQQRLADAAKQQQQREQQQREQQQQQQMSAGNAQRDRSPHRNGQADPSELIRVKEEPRSIKEEEQHHLQRQQEQQHRQQEQQHRQQEQQQQQQQHQHMMSRQPDPRSVILYHPYLRHPVNHLQPPPQSVLDRSRLMSAHPSMAAHYAPPHSASAHWPPPPPPHDPFAAYHHSRYGYGPLVDAAMQDRAAAFYGAYGVQAHHAAAAAAAAAQVRHKDVSHLRAPPPRAAPLAQDHPGGGVHKKEEPR